MDSLMPRSDSARLRGPSQMDFKTATTGVAAKAMRNEISNLVRSVSDPATKKVYSPSPPLHPTSNSLIASDHRRSTQRCSRSFTSSHVTSPSALTRWNCAYL